jgi:hypothetical protein
MPAQWYNKGLPIRGSIAVIDGTLRRGISISGGRKAQIDMTEPRRSSHEPILNELIAVLRPHAEGLRKWSVMRAIREQVERTFRRFCADVSEANNRACTAESAPFYRRQGTAGEVWALLPGRMVVLLDEKSAPAENDG